MTKQMVLKLKNGQIYLGDFYRYNENSLSGYEFMTVNGSVQISPDQIQSIGIEEVPETIQKAELCMVCRQKMYLGEAFKLSTPTGKYLGYVHRTCFYEESDPRAKGGI